MRFIQDIWITLKSLYYNPSVASLPSNIVTELNLVLCDIKFEYWKQIADYSNGIRHDRGPYNERMDQFRILLNCIRNSFPAYRHVIDKFVEDCYELGNERRMIVGIYLSENPQIIFRGSTVGECPICYDEGNLVTLHCNHSFHNRCIINWIRMGKMTCPCCRYRI